MATHIVSNDVRKPAANKSFGELPFGELPAVVADALEKEAITTTYPTGDVYKRQTCPSRVRCRD